MEKEKWVAIGETLRKAREALGLTLEQLSEKTNIPVWKLRLIEEGQFDRVDAPFYVKHYVRLCAEQLGLDASQLIGVEDISKEQAQVKSKRSSYVLSGNLNLVMLIMCFFAAALFFYSLVRFFNVLGQPAAKLVNTGSQTILLDGEPVKPGESILLKVGNRYGVKDNKDGCTIVSTNKQWLIKVENFEVVLWEK